MGLYFRLAVVGVGLAVAGAPLVWCVVRRLGDGRWPGNRRLVPALSWFWGLGVGELAGRLGYYSPCAFGLWFLAGIVLAAWLAGDRPRGRVG